MFRKRYHLRSSLLELTLQCNMRCSHCGSSAGERRDDELTTDQWKDACGQLAQLGCTQVTFTGGEPLVRPDWYQIAHHVCDHSMKFSLISNGMLLNESIVGLLRKLDPYAIAVSIDGASAESHDSIRRLPGSFQHCLDALERLTEAGIPTTVVTTVQKRNLKDLPALRNMLVGRKIAWQIQVASPMGRFPRESTLSPKEFYAVAMFIGTTRNTYSYKEMPITGAHCIGYHSRLLPALTLSPWVGCDAGIDVLSIQSNGCVKGCLSLPDTFVEGNIRETPLGEIWADPDSFSYNRNFQIDELKGGCRGCRYSRRCKGGCLSLSEAIGGALHGNPYCLYLIEQNMNSTL